ncbi:MAG: hypothetical protein ACXABI_08690 [Candidatus Hodarchaeales archaeon]
MKNRKSFYNRELGFAIFSFIVYQVNAICFVVFIFILLKIPLESYYVPIGTYYITPAIILSGIAFLIFWIISYFFSLRPNFLGADAPLSGDNWGDPGDLGQFIFLICLFFFISLPAYIIVRLSPFQDINAEERREQRKRKKEVETIRGS